MFAVLAVGAGLAVIAVATRLVLARRPAAVEPEGLSRLADQLGWRRLPAPGAGPSAEVVDEIRWLWTAYHLAGAHPAAGPHTAIAWAYRGHVRNTPIVVAASVTTIGGARSPSGCGLVVAQLLTHHRGPVRVFRRPSGLLPVGSWRSGVPAFDQWYQIDAPAPADAIAVLSRPVALAIAARGDWNFSIWHDRLVCLLTAPFASGEQVGTTVDLVAGLAQLLSWPATNRAAWA